jgi:hypothetical protein
VINVPNKHGAAFAIDEYFDPIPDMGWAIDSSIFIMGHTMLLATDFLNHIGPALDSRHLSCERNGVGRPRKPHITGRLGSQRAPHDPSSKILLRRSSRNVATCAQQARSQDTDEAPPCHTHRDAFPLLSKIVARG